MSQKGLASADAFNRLRHLILDERVVLRKRLAENRMLNRQLPDVLWFIGVFLCITSLIIGHILGGVHLGTYSNIFVLVFLMMLIACASIAVCKRSDYLLAHATQRTEQILTELESLCSANRSVDSRIPHCLQPDVQLVYRDDMPIQLPVLLLVHGDVVLLRSGQVVNFHCRISGDNREVKVGSVLSPKQDERPPIHVTSPRQDQFDDYVEALVIKAPISEFLTCSSTSDIHHRTQSPLNRFVSISTTLSNATWISLGLPLFMIALFHVTFKSSDAPNHLIISWILLLVGKYIFFAAGFTSWLLWRIAVAFTCAHFHIVENQLKHHLIDTNHNSDRSFDSQSLKSVLGAKRKFTVRRWMSLSRWSTCLKQMCYEFSDLYQSELDNSVLTLGAVSSVCCVQQDGLLSRPILTPEKIFFFRKRHHHHHTHQDLMKSPQLVATSEDAVHNRHNRPKSSQSISKANEPLLSPVSSRRERMGSTCSELDAHDLVSGDHKRSIVPIILNLRTDSHWPYLPHFEKPKWTHYLASLKPIGLALLLNNAHSLTKPRYRFWEHLTSLGSEFDIVHHRPDPLFSCQCYLAHRIGFKAGAVRGFTCCGSVGAYSLGSQATWNRLLQSPNESRSLNSIPQRHPLQAEPTIPMDLHSSCVVEHAFSAVFTNPCTHGDYQLITQATGDMLTNLCSDVWDGRDVSPLSIVERDALLDFYHRNASAAYCVGFSYAPLLDRLPAAWGDEKRGTASVEDPILIQLPQQHPTSWMDEAHSNLGAFDRSDYIMLSRPSSVRLPDTDPLTVDLDYGDSVVHRSTPVEDKHIESAFTSPYIQSPSSETNSSLHCPRSPNVRPTGSDLPHVADWCKTSSKTKPTFRSRPNSYAKLFVDPPRSGSIDLLSVSKTKQTSAHCNTGHQLNATDWSSQPVGDVAMSVQSRVEGEDWQSLLDNQIFLGLISMQYQVRPDVVQAIKQLDEACIRFVYFSRENELRSRVFAERLGLECGWNCHISLANQSERSFVSDRIPQASGDNHVVQDPPQCIDDSSSVIGQRPVVPSFITLRTPEHVPRRMSSVPVIYEDQNCLSSNSNLSPDGVCDTGERSQRMTLPRASSRHSLPLLAPKNRFASPRSDPFITESADSLNLLSSSSSSTSTSSVHPDQADQSRGFCGPRLSHYVTQNKSRLPCGIDNIRPHLQNVDNVPLQVPLFTDCSTASMREMIRIRQEYEETVCVIGSSYSVDSLRLMHCGDVAVAIQPELPKPCEIFASNRIDKNFSNSDKSFVPTECGTGSEHLATECLPLNSSNYVAHTKSTLGVVHALDLTTRLVCSLSPVILNLELPGFYVYELIHEAHASINNLYLSFGFHWLAPLPLALVQLFLLLLGIPTMPYRVSTEAASNKSSDRNLDSVLWLPSESLRTRLVPLTNEVLLQPDAVGRHSTIPDNLILNTVAYMTQDPTRLTPDFGAGQWLWFVLCVTPLLSFSVLDRRVERNRLLREPPVKRGKWLTKRKVVRVSLLTAARFLPSVLICVLSVVGHLYWAPGFEMCARLDPSACHLPNTTAEPMNFSLILEQNTNSRACWLLDRNEIADMCFARLAVLVQLVKDFTFLQLIWYLVLTSFTYANFGQPIQNFRWTTNPCWCISATAITGIQTIWFFFHGLIWDELLHIRAVSVLHPAMVTLGAVWCPILVIINELISWKERRLMHMEHRLARLYFGTKLGMYSPV